MGRRLVCGQQQHHHIIMPSALQAAGTDVTSSFSALLHSRPASAPASLQGDPPRRAARHAAPILLDGTQGVSCSVVCYRTMHSKLLGCVHRVGLGEGPTQAGMMAFGGTQTAHKEPQHRETLPQAGLMASLGTSAQKNEPQGTGSSVLGTRKEPQGSCCWHLEEISTQAGMLAPQHKGFRVYRHLQQRLGHLLVRDDRDEAVLAHGDRDLVAAGQVLEEDLDDAPAQLRQVGAVPAGPHMCGSRFLLSLASTSGYRYRHWPWDCAAMSMDTAELGVHLGS